MSEELIQNNFQNTTIGTFTYYSIGATTLRQLARNNIIPKLDYSTNENKKPDGLVLKSGLPFAILEWKEATKIKSQRGLEKAISQELCVAQVMNAKILIICSDKNTYFFNASNGEKIEIEGFNEYDKFIFNESFVKIFELISENLTSKTLRIQEKPKEYLNPIILSKQVWQDLWTVNGATPENALYTFVEFFIFKYLSDLKILRGMFSFQHLLNSYKENTEDEVLENYVRTIRPRMKELFPNSESDGTTIINGTIFVSKDQKAVQGYSATFKKILQRFYEFGELKNIDYDFKSLLFESFLKQSISKKNWGQFFTPLTVVNEVVEMADSYLKDGVKVCDPACGVGKFLLSSIAGRDNYAINNKKVESKINIYGFDKGFDHDEQKTIILAKANMLIYLTDFIKENASNTDIIAKEIFNKSFILETNSILGTLSHTTRQEYDLILTNPPYVSSGTSNLREEIKKDKELSAYYGNYGLGIESLFIEWIVNSLKKGGTAFIVIPDSFFIRQQDKKLRDYVRSECIIEAIISLPEKTFFTTLKKTSILVIKKRDGSISQKDFMYYLVSEIGETRDVNRFKIKDNDLKKSTAVFKIFNSGAENIEKYVVDERFKLVSNQFLEDDIWNFEQKLYSERELGQFGRTNKNKKLSIADYIYSIDEKNTLISSLMEEMKVVEAVESKKKRFE